MTVTTVTPDERPINLRLQATVTEEAFRRIRLTATDRGTSQGEVISELAERYLPSYQAVTESEPGRR